ncbi:MAG: chorismate mutase [Clostridia bacterium]|nr:chorismate mutase [Clostridia bacterium]
MRDIKDIRNDINAVDSKLKELFLERMMYVDQVLEYKKLTNTPVKNKEREKDIFDSKLKGVKKFNNQTKTFFSDLVEISCNYQYENISKYHCIETLNAVDENDFFKNVKSVCYQGIAGSYSYETAKKFFPDKKLNNVKKFEELFIEIQSGNSDIGIVPVENLTHGSVYEVYDLFGKYDVKIVRSCCLDIDHCLVGTGNLNSINSVISHHQAIGQCYDYIEKNGYNKLYSENTAIAAELVSQKNDPTLAAICSKKCAQLYNLNILKDNISNINNNKTKFAIITNKKIYFNSSSKIFVYFTLQHEKGTLSRVLHDFSVNNINLSKIESRPSHNDEWKYLFYVEADAKNIDVFEYFSKIRYMFEDFKIIGIYTVME